MDTHIVTLYVQKSITFILLFRKKYMFDDYMQSFNALKKISQKNKDREIYICICMYIHTLTVHIFTLHLVHNDIYVLYIYIYLIFIYIFSTKID